MDAQRVGLLAPLLRLWGPNFLLPALLIAALALRLYGIDWDDGHGFHPDERSFYLRADDMFRVLTQAPGHETWLAQWPETRAGLPSIGTALSAEHSPLNPRWFPLGSFLIYALVLIRSVAELFTDWGAMDLRFAGRTLTALADTASVALMFVIGRRMYGRWTGLLAAALTAFAVIHIQHAHFYRPEPFTVLTSLAGLWAMLRFADTARIRDAALLGLLVGLAMAPKVSVAPILAPLALVFLCTWKDRAGGRWSDLTVLSAVRFAPTVAVAGLLALAAFFITTPYAFLDFGSFLADIRAQAEMAREAGHWPFTWQYADTPAFWYQIRQTSVWGLGIPLGIVAWLAAPFTAWMAWRGGLAQRSDLLLLAWAVPAFVFLELFEVKFLRYVFPLMPFYILMGARMLVVTVYWARERRVRDVDGTAVPPDDAPFSEEWHATPPTVGDDLIFDEPIFGADAPFSEEWHATPPTGGMVVSATGRPVDADAFVDHQLSLWQTVAQSTRRYAYPVSVAALAVVVASTVLYALAFSSIYSRPHTAVSAAGWINANVPFHASVINGGSYWDERIPNLGRYAVWTFPAYHPDSDRVKMPELVDRLSSSDYVVFYSNRAYGSVARLPAEYPQSSAFLRLLFTGDLGYRVERSFTSYPSLAGFELRDAPYARAGLPPPVRAADSSPEPGRGIGLNLGYADENVIGYDHPQVLVFRNVDRLSAAKIRSRIDDASARAEETPPLMLPPDALLAQQDGGAWSQVFRPDGWPNRAPWLSWLLALEIICLIAFPITWWVLRPLHDRGLLFSRAVGLLLVAWVAWMLVNSGIVQFSTAAIGLAMLIVAIPSAAVLAGRWREMAGWLREHWGMVLATEMLFVLTYLSFVLIRAANPDLWHPWRGGEKPMELAYFTAVARSSVLPPYDPWFAGGYLNYYYWGYFILSIPTRLTGIPPVIAFNLAVPTLFALTTTGAGALAYYLVKAARPLPKPPGPSHGSAAGTWQRVVTRNRLRRWLPGAAVTTGLASAVMVAIAGNLDGVIQLFYILSDRIDGIPTPLSTFDFWRSSRAIPEIPNFEPNALTPWLEMRDQVDLGFHITEFPYFTFLFADLHAHMMTMPFALLAVALGFAALLGVSRSGPSRVWTWVCVALMGLAVGSLWTINSWEYPAYALLMVGFAGAAAWVMPGELRVRLALGIALALVALVVSYLAFLPFHSATETFGTGIEPTRWRTPLTDYLLIHALPLLAALSLLSATLPRACAPLLSRFRLATTVPAAHLWLPAGVLAGLALAGYFWAAGFLTAGVLMVLLTLTCWSLAAALLDGNESTTRSDVAALGMQAVALAISIGVDFVRVEGDIARMNTVFKYYLVAWLLLGVAGAYGFWRGWAAWRNRRNVYSRVVRCAFATITALVGVGVMVYPVLATPVRIQDRFHATPLTLDGAAWMPDAVHWERDELIELRWDADAIRWLQDNVAGSPVTLEAHGDQYRWNGRVSVYTGLPTLIGWPWHQTQQRNDWELIRRRAKDVSSIYNTQSKKAALDLIDQYRVRYIVVGDLERIYYLPHGIEKFDRMVEGGDLELAYANDRTSIYRVAGR
jgi:YYY domain-containing protein